MTNPLVTYLSGGTVPPGLFDWLRERHDPSSFDETVPEFMLNWALIMSAKWGHSSIAQLLLQTGAVNVNAREERTGWTALHVAVAWDQVAVAEVLTRFGADVNAKQGRTGSTALHFAAIRGCVAMAELLARVGANVNANGEMGESPIHTATRAQEVDMVVCLGSHGADVNAKQGETGSTALHLAAESGHLAVAKVLTRLGADVNANNKNGETPLHIATWARQVDMVEWLGSNGADLIAKNAKDQSPIDIALDLGRMDMVKAIWNAAYSKLEDLEKDTNSPVFSLLKEALAGNESHLAATVFKYVRPPKFEDLNLASEDRVSGIERKYVNETYDDLHEYVKMLEKAKKQQLEGSTKPKLQEPLHSDGPPK